VVSVGQSVMIMQQIVLDDW